jgi:hypothetical protein
MIFSLATRIPVVLSFAYPGVYNSRQKLNEISQKGVRDILVSVFIWD